MAVAASEVHKMNGDSGKVASTRRYPRGAGDDVEEFDCLAERLLPVLREYLGANNELQTAVVDLKDPAELCKLLDADIRGHGVGLDELQRLFQLALKYSVRTGHPLFLDKLYTGTDPVGQFAELLTSILNTNVHAYHVSPVFSVVEIRTIHTVASLIGYSTGGLSRDRDDYGGDGVFCPGGSYCNMMAMLCARDRAFPHMQTDGVRPDDRPISFTSEHGHYSVRNASLMLGLGTHSVAKVRCDKSGRIDVDSLRRQCGEARRAGRRVFFISCTAGTTVCGAYDPIDQLAEVAREYGAWLHVDGAWGGSVIVSHKHKHLIKGIDKSDSFAWCPHKALGVPLTCSMLIVKERGRLERATGHHSNTGAAAYLLHSPPSQAAASNATAVSNGVDTPADTPSDASQDDCLAISYVQGSKTLQCGRHGDALKLWLMWKWQGTDGLASRIDLAFSNAAHLTAEIRRRQPTFQPVLDAFESLNVCFWYVPVFLRELMPPKGSAGLDSRVDTETRALLGAATRHLRHALHENGRMLVDFASLSDWGYPPFFRVVISSPKVTPAALDMVLSEIERLGEAITSPGHLTAPTHAVRMDG